MRSVILLAVIVMFTSTGNLVGASASNSCTDIAAVLGCPQVSGQVGSGAAVIDGNLTTGGSPGSSGTGPGSAGSVGSGGSGGGDRGAARWGGSGSAGVGAGDARLPCVVRWVRWCVTGAAPKPSQPGQPETVEATPGAPLVTIRDVAVFRPQPATQFMQPDGWMVVGLPTNFYAAIDRHVVSGTLLGLAADVRFTPAGYEWRYGDGTRAWLPDKGASWQASGLS
jgi:hypothetical protein